MADTQEQAESITPDAELSSSAVVPPMVEEPSVAPVQGDKSSPSTWQWLWWAVILLLIAGWAWKHWKASKNGATKAKQRHPYVKFFDTYKTFRSNEHDVRNNTMN